MSLGANLYDTITTWNSFDEEKAAYIMSQILSAVNYLHSKNIVHRDIKPENMLVESKTGGKKEMVNIKLIDFGTCNFFNDKQNLTLKVGSPYYIAPEVLKRNYNEKCDIWSCGVILYILLVGEPPFKGSCTEDLLHNVEKGKFSMDGPVWNKISSEAKDLVIKMLELDPKKRISAKDAMDHTWIKNIHHKVNTVDPTYFEKVCKNIYEFNNREKLQQATVAYIVHFLYSSQELEQLKKIFKSLDKNGNGRLEYQELKTGFEQYFGKYLTDVEINKVIEEVDGDNDGFISYEEFLRVSINQKQLLDEKNLKLAYDRFDLNKDGRLSKEEVKKVLGTTDHEYINLLLSYIDENNDGYISFEEFKNLMNGVINKKIEKRIDKRSNNNFGTTKETQKTANSNQNLSILKPSTVGTDSKSRKRNSNLKDAKKLSSKKQKLTGDAFNQDALENHMSSSEDSIDAEQVTNSRPIVNYRV